MILLHHVPVCSSVSDMAVQASVASFRAFDVCSLASRCGNRRVVAFFIGVCSVNT